MKKLFIPTAEVKDIDAIDFKSLYNEGYENIILDVDNTIVPWNDHTATPDLREKIEAIKDIGFNICLLSNNNSKLRVETLARDLGILAVPEGIKPFSRGFKYALEKLEGDIDNTVVIGDQIFTDVLGGNIMGMTTILVQPISKNEFLTTKFMRFLERVLAGRDIKDGHKH